MYKYCTLFDSKYLTRGLAMYQSLKKYSDDFHLYIFSFDDKSYELIKMLNLNHVTVISLKEFEDEALLEVKSSRTPGEYCWTCTPSVIKYCIDTYDLDHCTYLDADIYFFNNPSILIDEIGNDSVLITEHRYTPQYDQSLKCGIYCVQFITFKNDKNGMKVLNWWRNACIDWCYARFEDGKFGDQKYLDDWIYKFDGIHVLKNRGGGVAPWNIQQYDLVSDKNITLIFYHFHNYKFLEGNLIELGDYILSEKDINILYKPYTKHLDKISKNIESIDSDNNYNGIVAYDRFNWKNMFRMIKRLIKGNYNIFNKDKFLEA